MTGEFIMVCLKCGKELLEGAKYCTYCGEMIDFKTNLIIEPDLELNVEMDKESSEQTENLEENKNDVSTPLTSSKNDNSEQTIKVKTNLLFQNLKEKVLNFWQKLTEIEKVITIIC